MNEVHVGQKLPVGGLRGHINLPDLENHFIHLTVMKSYISHKQGDANEDQRRASGEGNW